jgi:hypothetical protein
MTNSDHLPKSPADAWLSKTFPLRHVVCAELATDLGGRNPIPVDVAQKSFFGNLMELAIGLSLCDPPPYLHLFGLLGGDRTARLVRRVGYVAASKNSWQRSDITPATIDVFLTAYRLAQVYELLNPRWTERPNPEVVARILRRHPEALPRHAGETRFEWRAFADLWASYSGGFDAALRSYGRATAQVPLLGGLRYADFLAGTTVLEIKSGRLDQDSYITQLINQMITYALLAHFDGHPVTHVGVYAVRYQRLLRFRIETFLNELAGIRIGLDTASADFADAVQGRQHKLAA